MKPTHDMDRSRTSYDLALELRAQTMILVPALLRGNEVRLRLERATWNAVESIGRDVAIGDVVSDDTREQAIAAIVRTMTALDVLIADGRTKPGECATVRAVARRLLSHLLGERTEEARCADPQPPPSASPKSAAPVQQPARSTVAPPAASARPARRPRLAFLRKVLFERLFGTREEDQGVASRQNENVQTLQPQPIASHEQSLPSYIGSHAMSAHMTDPSGAITQPSIMSMQAASSVMPPQDGRGGGGSVGTQ